MRAVNYHCEALSILDVCEFLSTSLFLMTLKLQAEYRNPSQILSPILSKTFFVAKKKEEEKTWYFASKGSVWVLVQLQSKSLRNADFVWPVFSHIRTVSSIPVFSKILYNDQFTRQKNPPQSWRLQLLMNRVFF